MTIRKNNKRSNKRFRKTRSKKQRCGKKSKTKKNVQKGCGGTKSNNTRIIEFGSASFTPYKIGPPANLTKYGALPGSKAYRAQVLKRREEREKEKSKK